jgi:hypothetical protein
VTATVATGRLPISSTNNSLLLCLSNNNRAKFTVELDTARVPPTSTNLDIDIKLAIDKITPVSVVDQGRNFFRVEAIASGAIDKLRPGMEGVGKIQVERRKLIWIWTHKLTHWVRMWVWSWWP